jgi:hypothetical protein
LLLKEDDAPGCETCKNAFSRSASEVKIAEGNGNCRSEFKVCKGGEWQAREVERWSMAKK